MKIFFFKFKFALADFCQSAEKDHVWKLLHKSKNAISQKCPKNLIFKTFWNFPKNLALSHSQPYKDAWQHAKFPVKLMDHSQENL